MARSLEQIDAALAAQEQAPKGLADEKALDKILELNQKMDSMEKGVYERNNVALTALETQSNDIGDAITRSKVITETIEETMVHLFKIIQQFAQPSRNSSRNWLSRPRRSLTSRRMPSTRPL